MDNNVKNLVKLGTIGFGYRDWEGVFYPEGLPTREYLKFYNRHFNALEIDTTFYGSPKAETVNRWVADTDDDFIFCVKTPREITHTMGLVGTRGLMSEFCDSIRLFGGKLGAILIQLPPSFTISRSAVLINFLQEIPSDLRFAIEFRNPSWYTDDTAQLLTDHNVCWVISEYPGLPMDIRKTSDYLYIRWIGEHGKYRPHTHERIDKSQQLMSWWANIKPFLDTIQVFYGFFNNDYAGFAAGTCEKFMKIVGLPIEENNRPKQQSLF